MTLIVDPSAVRDYMALNQTPSTSQYTDGTIGSNILSAQSSLEKITGRYFVDRTFTDLAPWVGTTMLRAVVPLPGFRVITKLSWGGSILNNDESFWLLPDSQQSGVYTSVQFRAFRADSSGMPWWIADSNWYDKAYDSPFYPGNYGGGYFYSSMPNDLRISGSAGYTADIMPFDVLHAVKVLAAWYTVRPASVLGDSAITPQGNQILYSTLPPEVREFIGQWTSGSSNYMVSVGG